jgi:hypothetical protein
MLCCSSTGCGFITSSTLTSSVLAAAAATPVGACAT